MDRSSKRWFWIAAFIDMITMNSSALGAPLHSAVAEDAMTKAAAADSAPPQAEQEPSSED